MIDHVLFEDNATQNVPFLICLFKLPSSPYGVTGNNCNNVVSPVFILYSSSFVGSCPGTMSAKT